MNLNKPAPKILEIVTFLVIGFITLPLIGVFVWVVLKMFEVNLVARIIVLTLTAILIISIIVMLRRNVINRRKDKRIVSYEVRVPSRVEG